MPKPSPAKSLRACLVVAGALAVLLPAANATEWVGTVVGIADGDTLTLIDANREKHRIRLEGIDAPERTQSYGQRARKSLAELAHGRSARADCPKSDRYGRSVCRVTVDGVDVGLEQIRRGLAWHYIRYAPEQQPRIRLDYAEAEEHARAQRAGLWALDVPVAPWDFRRGRPDAE